MKKFALIGAAGYVAPRHMRAIKDTGNILVAALDTNDSVGIMDSYFPEAEFFTEYERFDRHIDKMRRGGEKNPIDYLSVCSPNYLHDSHVRFGLRSDADVICEKPLVLNPWNINGLKEIENDTGRKVNTILQLRLHPSVISLKKKIEKDTKKHQDIELTYITSRGKWYSQSWKGDEKKSGGIASNIGVHFFDMLNYIFGEHHDIIVNFNSQETAAGVLKYKNATVRWFLSIDSSFIPLDLVKKGQKTYRSIQVGGNEVEFSDGFSDLHTKSYEKILQGFGYGLDDCKEAIQIVSNIRNIEVSNKFDDFHPFLNRVNA